MAYIGNGLEGASVNKYEYTATEGQTTFSCVYDTRVDVFLNGVLLSEDDYTASTGTSIVLNTGTTAGDIVQIDAFRDVATTLKGLKKSVEHTATEGQTDFAATYTEGFLDVFLNGVRLDEADYTATNGTTVVLTTGATAGDIIYIQAFETFDCVDTYNTSEIDTALAGKSDTTHNHDADYAAVGHNHDGTYEPADATILKDADIGTSVLAPNGDGSQLQNLPAGGKVLQAKLERTGAGTSTTSTSWVNTSLSFTITPQSATSTLYVTINAELYGSGGNESNFWAIGCKKGTTQLSGTTATGFDGDLLGQGCGYSYSPFGTNGYARQMTTGIFRIASGSTSSQTFTMTIKERYSNGTTTFSQGQISVLEIEA